MRQEQQLVCGAKLKGVSGVKLSKQRRQERAKQPCHIITYIPEGSTAAEVYGTSGIPAVDGAVQTGGVKRQEPARSYFAGIFDNKPAV